MRRLLISVTLGLALFAPILWAHDAGVGQTTFQTLPPSRPDQIAPPGRGPTPPLVPGTGVILGQVIDGATGEPIADAIVNVNRGGAARLGAPGTLSPEVASLFQPVVTGADGRFVFRNLPPGTYPVAATLGGYVSGMVGQGRPGGPDRALDLADGQRIFDATIRLWKFAAITGTVVDEAGEPAVQIGVNAYRRMTVDGRPQLVPGSIQRASTDDRGRFRLSHLTPGDYVVVVPLTQTTMPAAVFDSFIQSMMATAGAAPPDWYFDLMLSGGDSALGAGPPVRVGDTLWGSTFPGMPPPTETGRVASYRTTYYPSATSSTDATVLTARAGEERTGVNIQLNLVPAARISGSVMGPAGPVAMLAVRLQPASADPRAVVPELEMASAITRPDGSFTFYGVPAGQYVLRIIKVGRSLEMMRALAGAGLAGASAATTPPTTTTTLFGEQQVAVGESDVTGVSLVMQDGPKVSGRVEFELTPPRTAAQITSGGGVTLAQLGGATGIMGMLGDSAPLDADGRFATLGHAPGRYTLSVGRGGRGSASIKSVTVGGRDVTNAVFELRDADVSDVVIKVSDRFGTLSGVVRGVTGAPFQTATTIVFPVDYRALVTMGLTSSRVQMVAASRAGAYTVSGLLPGDYFVAAVDDADVSDNQDVAFFDAIARAATRVTVGDADKKVQDLVVVKVKR